MPEETPHNDHSLTPREIAAKLIEIGMPEGESRVRSQQLFRATLGHRGVIDAFCCRQDALAASPRQLQTVNDFVLEWWRHSDEISRLVDAFSTSLEVDHADGFHSLTVLLAAPILTADLCEQLIRTSLLPDRSPDQVMSAAVGLGLVIDDAAGRRLSSPALHRMATGVSKAVLGEDADRLWTVLADFSERAGDFDAAFEFRCAAGDFVWLESRLEADPSLCVSSAATMAAQSLYSRDLSAVRRSPLLLALLACESLEGAVTASHALRRLQSLREQHHAPLPTSNSAQLAAVVLLDSLLGPGADSGEALQERRNRLLAALRSESIRSDKQATFAALSVAHSALLDSDFALAFNTAELGRVRSLKAQIGSSSTLRRALTATSAYAAMRLGEVYRATQILELGIDEGHAVSAVDYWGNFSRLTTALIATERNVAEEALETIDLVAPSLSNSPAWPHLVHARIRIARRFTALVPDQILAATELINSGWQYQSVLESQWQVTEPMDDETSHDYSYRQLMQPGVLPPKTAAQFTLDVTTSMLIARFLKYAHRAVVRNKTRHQNARELARGWHALHTSKNETALRCASQVDRESLVSPYHRVEAFALEAAGYWEVGDQLRALVAFRGALGLIKTSGPHATAFALVPHETLVALRASFVQAPDTSESLAVTFDGLEIAGLENFWRKTVRLTRREQETLTLAAAGHSTQEIGDRMFISYNTAKRHLSTIYQKLGVTSRRDAINIGLEYGFIAHDEVND
ncbi:hypothetical protein C5B85_03345 [Pseudoclavibacter sp. AY1F1]|uniref:helix-turn-helix transcriptional regulator n=1 Tax=Pseudoclavibacter sp. AY1F1 TaxID=2080583 RepID=UPI000CE76A7D|nr:helix-turn-helix transcriptional regulator [Pseudoclavibacter sp. AY1F1]PPF47311.1 hypothetical protein C5B85_03345 [Pseudoclavibacter sp. AY1F1]